MNCHGLALCGQNQWCRALSLQLALAFKDAKRTCHVSLRKVPRIVFRVPLHLSRSFTIINKPTFYSMLEFVADATKD